MKDRSSFLRYVPPSVARIPIDWTRVPEASKEHMELWAYDSRKRVTRPLPATIADLAKSIKFFGYFELKLTTLKYLEQVWYLLFTV